MRKITLNLIVCAIALFFTGQVFAQITPTAGATETFNVVTGDVFTDPGGQGGDCAAPGVVGNYPNCNCTTTTTLVGANLSIDFMSFGIWGHPSFDNMEIYDGDAATGTLLLDTKSGCTSCNFGLTELAALNLQTAGTTAFSSSTGMLTVVWFASGAIDRCGWEAIVSSATLSVDCQFVDCPADVTVTQDYTTCTGIVSLTAPSLPPECVGAVSKFLDADNEDYASFIRTTTATSANTALGMCNTGDEFFFIDCTGGYPGFAGGSAAPLTFDDTQMVIDDDEAGSGGANDGIHCFTSPVLDMSAGAISLGYDWQYNNLSDTFYVEAYDGTSWIRLQEEIADGDGTESFAMTGYTNSDFQVRFCLDDDGGWTYGFAVDNIELIGNDATAVAATTNDYTNTSGDIIDEGFPVGTTTVTFSTFDNSGNLVTCQTDVTVEPALPLVVCPGDITVVLDGGECESYTTFNVETFTCNPLIGVGSGSTLEMNPGVASNNQGAAGGVIYFDVMNNSSEPLRVTEMSSGQSAATDVLVYAIQGSTGFGNEGNMAAWTLIHTASSTVGPFAALGTNDRAVFSTDFILQPGLTALALVTPTAMNTYINGIGGGGAYGTSTNSTFSDGILDIMGGAGNNVAFVGAGFNPRVWAGSMTYESLTTTSLTPGLTQIAGIPSGEGYPIGTTTNTFLFMDADSVTDTCSFDVIVLEFPGPITDLACNDEINVSPDQDCEVFINADMMLEGGQYRCYDHYVVTITDLNDNPVPNPVTGDYVGQKLKVTVTDTAAGTTCWGYANIEDKLIPALECDTYEFDCDSDVSPGQVSLGTFTETVSGTPGSVITSGTPVEIEIPLSFNGTFNAITDVNVSVDISHTWVDDVQITLTSPNGTVVNVMNGVGGCQEDDMVVTFDDQAANAHSVFTSTCNTTPPAVSGVFQPLDDLADFNGEEASGTWMLTVVDNVNGDDGILNSYSVTFTAESTNGVPLPIADTLNYVDNGDGTFTVSDFDPCSDVTLSYEDEVQDIDCTNGEGYTGLILRHWTAVDGYNSTTCTDSIWLKAASLATLNLPLDRDNIDAPALQCGGWNDYGCDGIEGTGDEGEGDGIPDACEIGDEVSAQCDIWANYVDEVHEECGNTVKIFRDWRILDKCTGELLEHTQIIIVMDTVAPTIVCPLNIDVSSSSSDCSGSYQIPAPEAYDNCGEIAGWSVTSSVGTIVTFGPGIYTITDLPLGCTPITYTVYDECGNSATCETEICVVDNIPPVPICDQNTRVSLGSDGLARIYAGTFDDGSYDNCGVESILVKRKHSSVCDPLPTWLPYVDFCCDDLLVDSVVVEMLVIDYAGNTNSCWIVVRVEDKLAPQIVCPPNVTVSCDFKFDLNDLSTTFGGVANLLAGETRSDIYIDDEVYQTECLGGSYQGPVLIGKDGYTTDNCDVEVTEQAVPDLECGVGTIQRFFVAVDKGGRSKTCIQTITIVDCDPFTITDTDSRCGDRGGIYSRNDDVEWPCDVTLDGCTGADTDPSNTGRPEYEDDKCSLVADTFVDEVFTVVDGACFKILRHWSIIDWCQKDPNTNLPARWDYTQVIKVIDEDGPIVTPAPVTCDSSATTCAGNVSLKPTVDDCTPEDHLVYWWRIDAYNDGVGSLPGGFDFEGTTADPSGDYPYGTHRILWVIEDMCGNRTTAEYEFEVLDCKKPTPVCINGLSSVVMPASGAVTIWAVDFDASSFDNCDDNLDFRIWYSYMDSASYPEPNPVAGEDWDRPTASTEGDVVLSNLPTGAAFYCEALGNGVSRTFEVEIYVVDDAGNWDYCTTTITIDDNDDVCPDNTGVPIVSGNYSTEDGVAVEEVMVTLTSNYQPNPVQTREVDANGNYRFYIESGYNYNVSGVKDDHHLNGVTANDLSMIQRHTSGIKYLESNYKIVAADANGDTELNVQDVLDLRRLLLGITDELPNNDAWVSVDVAYTFPGITNTKLPSDVYAQNMISYDNVQGNKPNTDYIAVKVGDVDGDAAPSSALSGATRTGGQDLVFATLDQTFVEGQEVVVNITSENFENMDAYQMTFGFDNSYLEFVGVQGGVLNVDDNNFGLQNASRGQLTTVWYSTVATTKSSDDVLFTMTFRAKQSGSLSEMINISSATTEALAFGSENGAQGIDLRFVDESGETAEVRFALKQNEPNPFDSETKITYTLPEDADVTFSVYDVNGRVLLTSELEGESGVNEITIKRSDIPASGVLYYQVETDDYSATKKMIVVE